MNYRKLLHHFITLALVLIALPACSMLKPSAPVSPPRFPIMQDGKGGYIDRSGNIVIQPQFEWTANFSEGLGLVEQNGHWGYIDVKGKIVIQPSFDEASLFHDGRAKVKVNDKYGFIDPSGKMVISAEYDDASDFSENMASVMKCTEEKRCTWMTFNFTWGSYTFPSGGEHSYIDPGGGNAIPSAGKFTSLLSFHEGLAAVSDNNKYGYINSHGALTIQLQFDSAGNFSGGLASVKKGDQWGYVGNNGKMAIPPQFDEADIFSDGLAAVKQGELWGYVDKAGKMVSQPKFEDVLSFSDGLAAVWLKGNIRGYINPKGEYVWAPSK
jgi:hypothetical protein